MSRHSERPSYCSIFIANYVYCCSKYLWNTALWVLYPVNDDYLWGQMFFTQDSQISCINFLFFVTKCYSKYKKKIHNLHIGDASSFPRWMTYELPITVWHFAQDIRIFTNDGYIDSFLQHSSYITVEIFTFLFYILTIGIWFQYKKMERII